MFMLHKMKGIFWLAEDLRILCFCSSVAEVSVLLGYYLTSLDWSQMFQKSVAVPCSTVRCPVRKADPCRWECWLPHCSEMWHQSSSDKEQYCRITETLAWNLLASQEWHCSMELATTAPYISKQAFCCSYHLPAQVSRCIDHGCVSKPKSLFVTTTKMLL